MFTFRNPAKAISKISALIYNKDMDSKNIRHTEQGNALFYILIAVALLAALSYSVANSGRGNVAQLNEDRARLYANELIEYASNIGNAVAQLRLRGCTDTEISFENNVVAGYTNGTNTACQIFHPNGGGVVYTIPNENMTTGLEWGFSGSRYIDDVGSWSATPAERAELYMGIAGLPQEVCTAINNLVDVSNPSGTPPVGQNAGFSAKFVGTYDGGNRIVNPADAGYDATVGKLAFCLEQADAQNAFVKVLIAR